VTAALKRFRIIAWVVGVMLLVLVFVAVPLHHFANKPALSSVVGPLHGFLFVIYLLAALDLAVRLRWKPVRAVLIMISGTIPFMSFLAERSVSKQVAAILAAEPSKV
jgi:integral membrane protein